MELHDMSEIAKSGAMDKMADLVHKLAGPMAEEFGLFLGDKVRAYRAKNLSSVMLKTERILLATEVSPNAVPPRLLLPIMEASSVEDNDVLQELWAGLLATASQETDDLSPSFIETLKQLTPNDAQHLDRLAEESVSASKRTFLAEYADVVPYAFGGGWGIHRPARTGFVVPSGVHPDTYERLGLFSRKYVAGSSYDHYDFRFETEIDHWYVFTGYAVSFLEACHGPAPVAEPDHSG